jgi:hypothetical protein
MREKQLREKRIHNYVEENITLDTEHQRNREIISNLQRKPTPQLHEMREGDDNNVMLENKRTIQMDFGVSIT